MTIRDGFTIVPEVEYAIQYLEKHGEVFGVSFGIHNAIDKAAEMHAIFLDDDRFEELNGFRPERN